MVNVVLAQLTFLLQCIVAVLVLPLFIYLNRDTDYYRRNKAIIKNRFINPLKVTLKLLIIMLKCISAVAVIYSIYLFILNFEEIALFFWDVNNANPKGELLKLSVAVLGGFVALFGLIITFKRVYISEMSMVSQNYKNVVELLSNDKINISIGSIHLLHNTAQTYSKYRIPVLGVLCSYAKYESTRLYASNCEQDTVKKGYPFTKYHIETTCPEVLSTIFHKILCSSIYKDLPNNLDNCIIKGVHFSKCNIYGICNNILFEDSIFEEVYIKSIIFNRCQFKNVIFDESILINCEFRDCLMDNCNFAINTLRENITYINVTCNGENKGSYIDNYEPIFAWWGGTCST